MSIHYKFKWSPETFSLIFDGLHISVADLKKEIMKQRKIGKSADFDLQITDSQTKEVYKNDSTLIPKNTAVEVARVPIAGLKKNRERNDTNASKGANSPSHIEVEKITKSSNMTSYSSEDDAIKAMMSQSTHEYDVSKYAKNRGPIGPLPPNYTCYRCGNPGHYIKQCPTNNTDVKRSTGIPRSFMIPANADQKGALLTASGDYAVPIIDHQAYKEVKKEKPPFLPNLETEKPEEQTPIPEDIRCLLCGDLLQDAVLIPCCGNSFCDECIRNRLLDSESHECPECHENSVSPDSLIPNRYLRTSVNKFKNDTGYSVNRNRSLIVSTTTVKPEAKNIEIKPEEPVNNIIDTKCTDSEVKADSSPSEPVSVSPIIQNNGSTDVTLDEVILDSTKKDFNQKSDETLINGQTSGLSDELIGSQSPISKDLTDNQNESHNDLSTGAELLGVTEQAIESYESTTDQTSAPEGNPVMSLASFPTQHMMQMPGYPRPPRMIGPIRPIRTTLGQQQSPQMIGRPPPNMMQHPRAGVYPRAGMPAGFRPMTDPRGFPMGMTHSMAPYGYPPQMRPYGSHDPYGYMGPRTHMNAAAMHPMAMGNMGEAPPPGSAPIMAEHHFQYQKPEYDDYEDRFNRFTRQLESRSRGRPKRNRSISRSRSRSRSRSPKNRSSRSRSSSTSSSTSSSSSSSSLSFSSKSRSYSPVRRRSRSRSYYRTRRSRSPSPRYREYGRDNRYRRTSRSPFRDSRRYADRTRVRYDRERDPKYKESQSGGRYESHRSAVRSDDKKKKESKQTHNKSSSKTQEKSRTSEKSKRKNSRSKTPVKDENNDKSCEVEVKTEPIETKVKTEANADNDSNKTQEKSKSNERSKRKRSHSKTPVKEEVTEKSVSDEVVKSVTNDISDKIEIKIENESNKSDDRNRSSDKSKKRKNRTKSPAKEETTGKNSETVLKTDLNDTKNLNKDNKSDQKLDNDSNRTDKKSSSDKTRTKDEKRDKTDVKTEKDSKKSKPTEEKSDKSEKKPEKEKSDENKDKKKSKDKSKKHHKHHHHKHHKHRKSSDEKETKKDDQKSSSTKRSSKKSSMKSVVS